MKNDTGNYAMYGPNPYGESIEHVCMNCMTKFYTAKVLCPDNVYRQLPGWCRKCDVSVPVVRTKRHEESNSHDRA